MTTPRDFTKRALCPRCCKQVVDIHTCTPTPLVRELEQKCARLRAENETFRTALKNIAAIEDEMYGGDWDEIERARQYANAALAAKEERMRGMTVTHWTNGNKVRTYFSDAVSQELYHEFQILRNAAGQIIASFEPSCVLGVEDHNEPLAEKEE